MTPLEIPYLSIIAQISIKVKGLGEFYHSEFRKIVKI